MALWEMSSASIDLDNRLDSLVMLRQCSSPRWSGCSMENRTYSLGATAACQVLSEAPIVFGTGCPDEAYSSDENDALCAYSELFAASTRKGPCRYCNRSRVGFNPKRASSARHVR